MPESLPPKHDHSRTLASDLQNFVQQFGSLLSTGVEPVADPEQILSLHKDQRLDAGTLHYGVVQYAIPHYGAARVALHGGGLIRCREGGAGGPDYGASDVSSTPHGTGVLVHVDPATMLGTITCTLPEPQDDTSEAFCDFVVAGSGVGFYASPHYLGVVGKLSDNGGAIPFAGDRPIDALPGDRSVMATTGVGWHVDNELAFLRTSEVCGLFLFREDGHARLTGESLAIEADGRVCETGIALGECFHETAQCLYPWESLGFAQYAQTRDEWTTLRGSDAIFDGPYAPLEPANIDTAPIPRIEEFSGYLGQGQLLVVSAPQGDGIHTIAQPVQRAGLFRQQVMIDGTYLLESARQIFIAKTADVPVLRRSSERDTLLNDEAYLYSGVSGVGDAPLPHLVQQLTGENPDDAVFAAEEVYSYVSAWQGLHAAVYHPGVEVERRIPTAGARPTVDLSQSDRAENVEPEQVNIDHRYGDVDIHRILSLFAILPNGDVVLRNGYGAEIKLAGGGVEISGTGITVSAAKTFAVMADQVSLHAQQAAELTSSAGAVRIKAETDLLMLGGNNRRGGVLIESRGSGVLSNWQDSPDESNASGLVLKAPYSHISVLGGDILLKTGPTTSDLRAGQIIIDSASHLTQRARVHHRYSQTAFLDYFGNGPTDIRGTNAYYRTATLINGGMLVNGPLLVSRSVQAGTGYTTASGHYASPQANRFRGRVAQENAPSQVQTNINNFTEFINNASQHGREVITAQRKTYEADNAPLNTENLKNTSFGFPSSQGYRAAQVVIRQPYWQRSLINQTASWAEPVVLYQGRGKTRPWPGSETWENPESLVISDNESKYFDPNTQLPIDPSDPANREAYEQAKLGSVSRTSMLSGFKALPS